MTIKSDNKKHPKHRWQPTCAIILGALTQSLFAAEPPSPAEMWKIIQQQQQEIESLKKQLKTSTPDPQSNAAVESEIKRETEILAEEVEKLKTQMVIPDEPEYKSRYGLGPAASKVYGVTKGLSIAGYGEGVYQNIVGDKGTRRDSADLIRLVLYAGYKFTDNILFNSEIEFEHATTGEGAEEKGEVSVEFANLDFFLNSMINIRAGLLLVPMGFINEIHEPLFFHGNFRPEVERRIIPSTWREMGAGLFGEILPGLQYRMYAVNGLNAGGDEGFGSGGIRNGRQVGSNAIAEDFAFTGRLDYTPAEIPGLLIGGSLFLGNAGQGETFEGIQADVFTELYEGHIQYRYRGLELRALGAWGSIDDAGLLSRAKGQTIGSENYGWYTEIAYDIMPHIWPSGEQYLAPFFRYEQYDTLAEVPAGFTDNLSFDREIYQVGFSYKPIPNVVIKADYRNMQAAEGVVPDEFNLGLGFIY